METSPFSVREDHTLKAFEKKRKEYLDLRKAK
jgi:hypothetical protein